MDSGVTPGPPFLEKETGSLTVKKEPSETTSAMLQLPPPLTYEGGLNSSNKKRKFEDDNSPRRGRRSSKVSPSLVNEERESPLKGKSMLGNRYLHRDVACSPDDSSSQMNENRGRGGVVRPYRRRGRGRGRARGRGATTRSRTQDSNSLLVIGKRKSPLRNNVSDIGSFSPVQTESKLVGLGKRKFGTPASVTQGLVRGSYTGRRVWRGRVSTRSRGVRGRPRRVSGVVKKSVAKRSLGPILGIDNEKYKINYSHTVKAVENTAGFVFKDFSKDTNEVKLDNNLADTRVDSNGNITRIISNGDTTSESSKVLTPGKIQMLNGIIHESRPITTGDRLPLTQLFADGDDVLARWTDGLVYLGTIQKVEDEKEQCLVTFEDNSEHWVLFKDIQKAQVEMEDIKCSVCNDGNSDSPNEIVICDKCGTGFHQLCHQPFIESCFLKSEEVQWLCRKCIFANAVKIGGASNKGQAARMFQQVKRSLPYKIEDLKWDKHHRTNLQKCYCYCGGPGEWYLKMLQCCRCMQWFHEACIQCLSMPMLYGDRFFLFVCSVCNSGPEYIQRLPLKWIDLAHLILYNMTLTFRKKYFILEDDILPFLNEKWTRLQVDHLAARRSEKQSFLLYALQSSQTRFACGKEVKKKKDLWGLRNRSPPVPPAVLLPAVGQITDEVMTNFQSVKESKVMTFVPAGNTSPVPTSVIKRGRKSKQLTKEEIEKKTKLAKKQLLAATSSKNKVGRPPSVNQSYQGYAGGVPPSPKVRRTCGGPSILDTIEPLEEALERSRLITIHHPRCFVPQSSVHFQPLTATNNISRTNNQEVPKLKKKRGRKPKHSKLEIPKIKKKRGRKPKHRPPEDLQTIDIKQNDTVENENLQDQALEGNGGTQNNMRTLINSVTSYFGAEGRIASGEKYKVLAKRKTTNGKYQYLIEWEGTTP